MSAIKPRAAYCTGCGVTFPKMHVMMNHRKTDRCGGRFLPLPERILINKVRLEREAQERQARPFKKVRTDLPWWEAEDDST